MTDYAANTATPTRLTLTNSVDELLPLIKRLDKAIARVRGATDRINGTRPHAVDREEVESALLVDGNIMKSLRHARDTLARSLDSLERELNSLEECL